MKMGGQSRLRARTTRPVVRACVGRSGLRVATLIRSIITFVSRIARARARTLRCVYGVGALRVHVLHVIPRMNINIGLGRASHSMERIALYVHHALVGASIKATAG